MPNHRLESVGVVAHRIRMRCSGLGIWAWDAPVRFTVSIGLSVWTALDTIDDLLRRADVAFYVAKQGGRDRVALSVDGSTVETLS